MKDVLITARGFIDTPEKWVKNFAAKNKQDHSVNIHSPDAVCFCMSAALVKSVRKHNASFKAFKFLREHIEQSAVCDFNDDMSTTHTDVMEVFDKAIAAASES